MDKFEIQRIRDLNIERVAERLGLDIKRHKALCCFHDDHNPSLYFNVRRNSFCCFSCGAHGGVIDLAMHILNKSFIETCEWLANENNILLTDFGKRVQCDDRKKENTFDASRYERYFVNPTLSPEARHFLFDVRHLHPAVVRFCRLNSYGEWLQIPYYDQLGRMIGIQSRYMGHDPQKPRFRFPTGVACHLYNQQVIPILRPDEPIYLGEGPSDVWALLSSGKKAVGVVSATTLRVEDLKCLAGREVRIYPDNDSAGLTLYQKLVSAANDIGFCLIRQELPEGCKDFSDYWVMENERNHES